MVGKNRQSGAAQNANEGEMNSGKRPLVRLVLAYGAVVIGFGIVTVSWMGLISSPAGHGVGAKIAIVVGIAICLSGFVLLLRRSPGPSDGIDVEDMDGA